MIVNSPLHVSVHSFDYPQGIHMPYFVMLLDRDPLICVRKSVEPSLVTVTVTVTVNA
jgi:hypothetical protein